MRLDRGGPNGGAGSPLPRRAGAQPGTHAAPGASRSGSGCLPARAPRQRGGWPASSPAGNLKIQIKQREKKERIRSAPASQRKYNSQARAGLGPAAGPGREPLAGEPAALCAALGRPPRGPVLIGETQSGFAPDAPAAVEAGEAGSALPSTGPGLFFVRQIFILVQVDPFPQRPPGCDQ